MWRFRWVLLVFIKNTYFEIWLPDFLSLFCFLLLFYESKMTEKTIFFLQRNEKTGKSNIYVFIHLHVENVWVQLFFHFLFKCLSLYSIQCNNIMVWLVTRSEIGFLRAYLCVCLFHALNFIGFHFSCRFVPIKIILMDINSHTLYYVICSMLILTNSVLFN